MSGNVNGLLASFPSAVSHTYATWNPSDIAVSHVTLSNGNLTASASAGVGWDGGRATLGKSAGKWYWEITINTGGTSNDQVNGIGKSNMVISNAGGDFTNSLSYYGFNGNILIGAPGSTACGASYTTGDIVGIGLDLDGGTLTIYKNNVQQCTRSVSGTYFPAFLFDASTQQITANFGASAFSGTVPVGYNSGLYV